jgi:hypothetical protein
MTDQTPPATGSANLPPGVGGAATMYTRENLTVLFKCSHGELGRLLARKMAPLPVRIDGQILWYIDEVQNATATVLRTLERWKQRR